MPLLLIMRYRFRVGGAWLLRQWGAGLLGLALNLPGAAPASDGADLLKAAMIEKVARFIDWPAATAANPAFVICVDADNPLLPTLRSYYEKFTLADRPVHLQTVRRSDSLSGCRAAYLAPREVSELARWRSQAEIHHVLLLAEGSDAARSGVHVGFYTHMNRLRIEVNRKSLEAAGLKASFRLLEVAKVVD